jgi:hypothetical protein
LPKYSQQQNCPTDLHPHHSSVPSTSRHHRALLLFSRVVLAWSHLPVSLAHHHWLHQEKTDSPQAQLHWAQELEHLVVKPVWLQARAPPWVRSPRSYTRSKTPSYPPGCLAPEGAARTMHTPE